MKTRKFKALKNGKETEFYVSTPSVSDHKEGEKVYRNTFNQALKDGSVVRARLDDILVEQGMWDTHKQMQFDTLQRQILDAERALEKGGIPLSTAKDIALAMRKDRAELRELISVKTNLDTHSAEGQAESQRFNYYVYACTYNMDNTRVFSDYEEYLNSGSEDLAIRAAGALANLLYNLEEDFENKLPENEFLYKYKFVDKKLRFIDKQGRLTDSEGRLINEAGRFIDEEGNYVDKYGNRIDEEGNYDVEFSPFTDEDGNPIVVEEAHDVASEQETVKKKPRPKKTESEN